LAKNNLTVVPPTPPSSVSLIQDKTERPPFGTVEVIEAEPQAVLNTLTENTASRMHLKMAEALGTVHMRGRGLLYTNVRASWAQTVSNVQNMYLPQKLFGTRCCKRKVIPLFDYLSTTP
jgi:hypothetical protein